MNQFVRNSSITFAGQSLRLLAGVLTSIVIARVLGPQGRGIYALCTLFPFLIITLSNMGIAPATAYYLAGRHYSSREILGNNILLSSGLSVVGMAGGIIITLWFREQLFPAVAPGYLFFSLLIIPAHLFFLHIQAVLLGYQDFRKYNLAAVLRSALFLLFTLAALWLLRMDIWGVLTANILAWSVATLVLFRRAITVTEGSSLKPNISYIGAVLKYGAQVHLGNLIAFLNYRADILLINWYLSPSAVGFYAIGVVVVEQLWLVSGSASLVLFPRIAAEKDERKRNEFTPKVARAVFLITIAGALVLFVISRWLVVLFYTPSYLPAVRPLQILLPGIVALSASRVIANDISARGRPVLNTYTALGSLLTNVVLNVLWIPKYGIEGAAWASTVSYSIALVPRLWIYYRLTGISWTRVLLPRRADWELYRKALNEIVKCNIGPFRMKE